MKRAITALVACLVLCSIMFQTAHAEYIGSDDSVRQTLNALSDPVVKNLANGQIVTKGPAANPQKTVSDSSVPTNPVTQSFAGYPSDIDSREETVEYVDSAIPVDQSQSDSVLDCAIWLTDSSGNLTSKLYPGQNYTVNIQFDARASATGVKVWLNTSLLNNGALLKSDQVGLIDCSWRTNNESLHRTTCSVSLHGNIALLMRYVQNSATLHTHYGGSFSVPDEELFAIGARLGSRIMDGEIARDGYCRLQFTLETEPVWIESKPEDSTADPAPSVSAELTLQELDDRINQTRRNIYDGLAFSETFAARQVNNLRSEFESQRQGDAKMLISVGLVLLVIIFSQQSKIKKLQDEQKRIILQQSQIDSLQNMHTDDIIKIWGELHPEDAIKEDGDPEVKPEDPAASTPSSGGSIESTLHLAEVESSQDSEPDPADACQPQVSMDFLKDDDAKKDPMQLIQEAEQLLKISDRRTSEGLEQLMAQIQQILKEFNTAHDGQQPTSGGENPPRDGSDNGAVVSADSEDSADTN